MLLNVEQIKFCNKVASEKVYFIGYFDIVVLSGISFTRKLPNNCLSSNLFVLTFQNISKELKSS